jgi:hypothetical protein
VKRMHNRTKPKARKQRRRGSSAKNTFVAPRTIEQFFSMSEPDRDFWADVGQVATEVKGGASLSQSARKYGRDPRKVRETAPAAFRKLKNGRYAAKTNDRILRVLVIPTRKGLREIGVLDFRQASLLGKYWTAVEQYRDAGDASALREFRGKHIIDAEGKRFQLLTNLHELDRLGSAGQLSFETLYAKAA